MRQTGAVPLTPHQVATLRAAVDRIVPADDYPSASELGVIGFLTNLMAVENLEAIYTGGLDGLDQEAAAVGSSDFAGLTSQAQDALLQKVERGETKTGWTVAPEEFFELLARQTVEGYYADPANGGNRDGIAWDMVGFRVTA